MPPTTRNRATHTQIAFDGVVAALLLAAVVVVPQCHGQQQYMAAAPPPNDTDGPAIAAAGAGAAAATTADEEPPEGYYAFIESPSAVPPKVRPPPYTHVKLDCKDLHSKKSYVSVHNLCGDLNKGQIPRNPMHQNVLNEPYPL